MSLHAVPGSAAGGGSGVTSLSAIGSSPNANGATITGTVLNLEPASVLFGGVVTTGTQTFTGIKNFNTYITTPEIRNLSANIILDFDTFNANDMSVVTSFNWTTRILYDSTASPSLDWTTRNTRDSGALLSIDWENRFLWDASSFQSIGWNARLLYDASNQVSIDWNTRQIIDSLGVISINYEGRALYNSSSQATVNYEGFTLIDAIGGASVSWDQRLLLYTDGATTSINYAISTAFSETGVASIDWDDRVLRNAAGSVVLNYAALATFDSTSGTSIDWENRLLYSSTGSQSLDWQNRLLKNTSGTSVIDYSAGNIIHSGLGSRVGLRLRGAASQSANLLELQDSTPTTLSSFSALASFLTRANTTAAGTAPYKFGSGGVLMTAAESLAVEQAGDKVHFTIPTGTARKEFTLNDIALTSGRIPFTTTNGRLTDEADLAYDTSTNTLTVENVTVTGTLSGGGASATGVSATVDFGSVGGGETDVATVAVAAAWVGASTKLVCTPFAVATANHDPDDYALEQITAYATNITAGVGFDIVATSKNGTFGQYVVHAIGV